VTVQTGLARHEEALVARTPTGLYIGGAWRDSADGGRLPSRIPPPGSSSPPSPARHPQTAPRRSPPRTRPSAAGPQPSPGVRSELLRAAYDLVSERADDLALLMTL